MLAVEVKARLGAFALDAALEAPPREVSVLVGESGSGKTTLLRLIAGLLEPDAGTIRLGDRTLADPARGVFVPPERRRVGYVAQDYALFPHLDVRGNVGFGLEASGLPARAVRERTAETLARFGLEALAARRPRELSGGQQQRVALARALALDPEILLLDEPLSALDVLSRRQVRGELRRILEGLPCVTVLVTHQPAEALAFGDSITVLESGRVSQAGSRVDFVRRPRSPYVAEFLGVNLLAGEVPSRPAEGPAEIRVAGATLWVPDPGRTGRARFVIHPHDIVISAAAPAGSARNVVRGVIEELIPEPPSGERVRLLLASSPPLAAQVTPQAVESLGLKVGLEVFASFKATAVQSVD